MEQQLITEMLQVGGFLQSRLSISGSEHVSAIAHKLAPEHGASGLKATYYHL